MGNLQDLRSSVKINMEKHSLDSDSLGGGSSTNVLAPLKKVTTFVFDVDGVLTNGTILIMPDGLMARQMNIKDGYALQIAIKKNYHVAIISGGNSAEVKERLQLLGVQDV